MKKCDVHAGKGYSIYIENNILQRAADYIRPVTAAKKICVISDTNVFPLYGDALVDCLTAAGFAVCQYVFTAGEASKTTDTVIRMVAFLAENELTRSDLVVALGGGVTGDMAGFAAAIYLRGIDFVQIPTSLLAQVDSSVGGKTAVDLTQGKNLCGAFHQPVLVLIDPTVLDTLPPHFFADGMAEAIKMGCIKSASLFEKIEQQPARMVIEEIIYECVSLKAGVVERDEKEHGERALLNFGHTAGHAIEKLHGFTTISHGEAVGIGMVTVCEAAERSGSTPAGTADRIRAVLQKYQLPTQDNHSMKEIVTAMAADKKRTGAGIRFVLLHRIGNGFIEPIAFEDINAFFGVA